MKKEWTLTSKKSMEQHSERIREISSIPKHVLHISRANILLSYVALPFNVGHPFCLMHVSRGYTACSVTKFACIYRNNSYSIYIAYYCAQT